MKSLKLKPVVVGDTLEFEVVEPLREKNEAELEAMKNDIVRLGISKYINRKSKKVDKEGLSLSFNK